MKSVIVMCILVCVGTVVFGSSADQTSALDIELGVEGAVEEVMKAGDKYETEEIDGVEGELENLVNLPQEEPPDGVEVNFGGIRFVKYEANPLPPEPPEPPTVSAIVLGSYEVPDGEGVCNSLNKTYMYYTSVTSVSSNQYRLLYSEDCYTDSVTGIRMVDGRMCIAVGTYYAIEIGTKINLIMENGGVAECILGDVKSNNHTDPTHRYQAVDGSVVEMIVDPEVFVSTEQYPDVLRGRVLRIEIVE